MFAAIGCALIELSIKQVTGNTHDFVLPERWNGPAATKFFAKALSSIGSPGKTVIDKSGANAAGIQEVNRFLKRFGCPAKVQTIRSKLLNNLIEQEHQFIIQRLRRMCVFKSIASVSAKLDGIEVVHMIRIKQFSSATTSGFQLFAEIAG
ncbi:DDE-type integrase/transposase/recombinase [uncultured Ruegeria sp.]|uniref:DDE-type integrase/transposase/recombinase n=1 Tax=uncultured Ruegeria sp. TaxID=259304 RepID=UPI00261B3719|nr:DDE-type integrase/transposase/recombinase [uncultured Ruegeria sp.]